MIIGNTKSNFIKFIINLLMIIVLGGLFYKCKNIPKGDFANNNIPPGEIVKSQNTFYKLITDENFKDYGLSYKNQVIHLKPGKSIMKYRLPHDKLMQYDSNQSLKSLLIDYRISEIPFYDSTGHFITSIEYAMNTKAKWEAVGFGKSAIFSRLEENLLHYIDSTESNLIDVPSLNYGFIVNKSWTKIDQRLIPNFYLNSKMDGISKTNFTIDYLLRLRDFAKTINTKFPG